MPTWKRSNWHELLFCGCKHLHYHQKSKGVIIRVSINNGNRQSTGIWFYISLHPPALLGPNSFLFLCRKRILKWARDHAKEWRKSPQPFCQNLKLLKIRAPIQLPRIVSMLFSGWDDPPLSLSVDDATFENDNWISYLRREYLLGLSQLDMDMLFHSSFFFSLLSVSFVSSSFVLSHYFSLFPFSSFH